MKIIALLNKEYIYIYTVYISGQKYGTFVYTKVYMYGTFVYTKVWE